MSLLHLTIEKDTQVLQYQKNSHTVYLTFTFITYIKYSKTPSPDLQSLCN